MGGPVPNRSLEDGSLAVALALTLRFDAVGTDWATFITLDPALPTGPATSLHLK